MPSHGAFGLIEKRRHCPSIPLFFRLGLQYRLRLACFRTYRLTSKMSGLPTTRGESLTGLLEHNPLGLNRKRNNRDSQRLADRRVSLNDDSGDDHAEALFA